MTDEFDSDFMRSIAAIDRPDAASALSNSAAAVVLREQACDRIRKALRAGQQDMADWKGGPLLFQRFPGPGSLREWLLRRQLRSPATGFTTAAS